VGWIWQYMVEWYMIQLTVVVLTFNEESQIADCLRSLTFADEIVVIDGGSKDHTIAIAKKHGAVVYHREFDDFASQRNYGLSKARGTWVLFVDADERVSRQLREEIMCTIKTRE
jgi:glycosyltransferase involved in cell wall biosynthesis